MMKNLRYLTIIVVVLLFATGCGNPIYVRNIENAYSNLKIGMTKGELDSLFGNFKLLKEQSILKYRPGLTDEEMRFKLKEHMYYKDLYPEDVFKKITFDGNVKVYSYLISRTIEWPNGWAINYVCIFYNQEENKVIGWGKLETMRRVEDWTEKF